MEEGNQLVGTLRAQYLELGLTVQPLILHIEPSTSLVVIDQFRLVFDNVVKALDVCFKMIQVNNIILQYRKYICL